MSISHSTLQQFFLQVSPLRAGKRLDPENFLKFPQYVGFSAYLIVKAGFSYRLLNDNQAETGGKEVEKLYARILGSSEVWEKSKYEIAKSIRR